VRIGGDVDAAVAMIFPRCDWRTMPVSDGRRAEVATQHHRFIRSQPYDSTGVSLAVACPLVVANDCRENCRNLPVIRVRGAACTSLIAGTQRYRFAGSHYPCRFRRRFAYDHTADRGTYVAVPVQCPQRSVDKRSRRESLVLHTLLGRYVCISQDDIQA
jgi:hypothetical protein